MSLSKEQISRLLGLVSSVESDRLDCDGCYGQIAEFAELYLSDQEIPEALKAVETHLRQCVCCQGEFDALLKGLREIENDE